MKQRIFFAAWLVLAGVSLGGCFWDDAPAPPVIQTKDVNIAVAQPCTVDTKNERPVLLTREKLWDQLSLMPSSDAQSKAVTSQLLAYMGWLPVVEDAMKGCAAGAPKGASPATGSTPR